jgi:hypothetical protein
MRKLAGQCAQVKLLDASARLDRGRLKIGRPDLVAYFGGIFDQARKLPDAALIIRYFRVAGLTVKARFTNAHLADVYSARLVGQRNAANDVAYDLSIDSLEAPRLGWPAPARWSDASCDQPLFHRTLQLAGMRAAYPYRPRHWEAMKLETREAIQLTETAGDLPDWDQGAPLQNFLHWAMLDRGQRVLHGATLGLGGKAILLAGPGGSGKSGTTLAGIAHGLKTVGDDYIVVEPSHAPIARPLYRVLKQDKSGVALIAGLSAHTARMPLNWQGKLEFDPESLFPGCMASEQRIVAIVVPSIRRAANSSIEPIDRNAAMQALARPTLEQFRGERDSGLLFCVRLSKLIPSFRLSLSEDPKEIAATIEAFIKETGP